MKLITKYILMLSFLLSVQLNAQTFSNTESDNTENIRSHIVNNQIGVSVLFPTQQNQNTVFVKQIGNSNTSNAIVSSNESFLTINQLGFNNNSYIDLSSSGLGLGVFQLGSGNNFTFQNSFREQSIQNEISQTGDNQNLEIYGTNSLLENLKIKMQGNSQSIIIRNFK